MALLCRPANGEDPWTSHRTGPEVEAEAEDVAGGIEPKPASGFASEKHLLGDLFGVRSDLALIGLSIDPILTLDYVKNLRGGRDTEGAAYLHLLELHFTAQTEPLLGINGGTFYANLLTQKGQSPEDEIGDYAQVDENTYDGRTQVSEIWYEQKLLRDKLRLKLGKVDVNTEFCVAKNSLDFSNGGLNNSFPNTQFDFMPTAADPAFGALAFVYPNDTFYFGAGVFDGALVEGFNGDYGPSTLFGPPADLYITGEMGLNFHVAGKPWRVALGGFHHTGTFHDVTGGTQAGNSGAYALLDATLWKEKPDDKDDRQGVGAFAVYDTADSDVTPVDEHFGGGFAWTGALPDRDDDVIGIGASYSHFAAGTGFTDTGELVVEGFYKLAVTKCFAVKADLQYIKDPDGTGLPDALAALLRVQIAF
jgi:porin